MDRVLVIGASGLLGGRLCEIGKDRYKIFGTYRAHKTGGESFLKLDVTRRGDVFKLIKNVKPDLVVDTHSITNVDYCETHTEEAWLVNVEGTKNIAEACKTFGSKMVFISTDYVFDGKKLEYGEKDKPNPLNYYGKTKAIAEKVLELLDVNHITARTSVLYGKGGSGKKTFVSWVLENLRNGREINVVMDQFNNPTFADDLASIIFALYEKDVTGIFHTVGSDCMSRYEFSLKIAKTFNLDEGLIKPVTTPELNQVAYRPKKLKLSTKKLARVIGRSPMGVEEGLKILKMQLGG